MPPVEEIDDDLAAEAEELDGYFSDAPLDPEPIYPPLNERFDTSVILLNLPKVGSNKLEKLNKVVVKLVSKIGALQATDSFSGVLMPVKDDNTLGFCLVDYQTPGSRQERRRSAAGLQIRQESRTDRVTLRTRPALAKD